MRTRLLTALMLIGISFVTKAQYVTIPDANFVAWLNANGFSQCMNGNQLNTSCQAVTTATQLDMDDAGISNFEGLQYFTLLAALYMSGNNVTNLPALPTTLVAFTCNYCQLTSLPNLHIGLQVVECEHNQLTSLPALPYTLKHLWCNYNQITQLPTLPALLNALRCENNQLTSLPALPGTLQNIECGYNSISALPTLPASTYNLIFRKNLVTQLPTLPTGLYKLDASNNFLTSLPPSLPPNINALLVGGNNIGNWPPLPNTLMYFDCSNCNLTSLPDIPDSMQSFNCGRNPQLKCLPRLGKIASFYFDSTGITCLPNYVNAQISIPQQNTFPICDMFNANNCEVYSNIGGFAYLDSDSNCALAPQEIRPAGINHKLYNNGALVQEMLTGNDGNYVFDVNGFGNYETHVDTAGLPFYVSCPANGVLYDTISSADSVHFNRNFALRCKTGFDLAAHSISTGQIFRPANNTTVNIQAGDLANFYHAKCAHAVAGAITVTINGPATYIAPANGAITPSSVSGNVITWNVADFGTTDALNDFNIVVRTDTFAQISQQVCFTVSVTLTVGDRDTANNTLTHCLSIVNSYDPNDKTAYPSGDIDTAQEWLTYRVRFQNTGNAEAQHIYIIDTLESGLDVSTFQLLAYSHQSNVQINENIVRFNFPNINLPDSFTNEPGSHGYVQYKVRLKEDLPIGTAIQNTAHIYFDFNPPVVTNTTVNTISEIQDTTIIGITPATQTFAINIYPNPANSQVTVTTGQAGHIIYMYTTQGKLVATQAMEGNATTLDIAMLPSGIYYIEVSGKLGTARKKLVKL